MYSGQVQLFLRILFYKFIGRFKKLVSKFTKIYYLAILYLSWVFITTPYKLKSVEIFSMSGYYKHLFFMQHRKSNKIKMCEIYCTNVWYIFFYEFSFTLFLFYSFELITISKYLQSCFLHCLRSFSFAGSVTDWIRP